MYGIYIPYVWCIYIYIYVYIYMPYTIRCIHYKNIKNLSAYVIYIKYMVYIYHIHCIYMVYVWYIYHIYGIYIISTEILYIFIMCTSYCVWYIYTICMVYIYNKHWNVIYFYSVYILLCKRWGSHNAVNVFYVWIYNLRAWRWLE